LAQQNFFIAMVDHIKHYLTNFNQYCVVCSKPHACLCNDPIVCCAQQCQAEYEEMRNAGQFSGCKVCPFEGCLAEYTQITSTGNMESGSTLMKHHSLLKDYPHKYLPNRKLISVIASNKKLNKITNIMKPDLVARFERKWEELSNLRGRTKPELAFHGTRDKKNIEGICEKGLLVPGTGNVKHATDKGYYGRGIYLSPLMQTSLRYASGSNCLFVCSVLMGKSFKASTRIMGGWLQDGYDSHLCGGEWIVFDCAQVLPCYLLEFN